MPPIASYLFLNGLRFRHLHWGGEGRPLVLLHGLSSNARLWELVAPTLAEHFRVFALDQRSHGLTDPAEDGFDFPSIVRDLHAFIEALNLERPILVGHSWGANTVLEYAATRPAGPAAIVLVDGGLAEMSSVPGMTWEKAEAMLRPPEIDGLPVAEFRARAKEFMRGWYSEAGVEIILANFRIDAEDRLYRRLPIPHHMRIARAIYEQKTSELYPRVRCPALLCPAVPPLPHDERAQQFLARKREGAARAEQVNPQMRTRWFEDTVHDIPLHRPAELAQAIVEFAGSAAATAPKAG
jgi:pimeloyl-ACP methyl ester carboxylesterase